jgi:hypothetical protein
MKAVGKNCLPNALAGRNSRNDNGMEGREFRPLPFRCLEERRHPARSKQGPGATFLFGLPAGSIAAS